MICFDTMLLIWGVQGVARPAQTRMVDLTRRFIDSLGKSETIMLPSVVVAEYLTGFKDEKRRLAELAILSRRFFVPAFDPPAAALAASISQVLPTMDPGDRRCIKADIQIIATAIVHGAERIVTGNLAEYRRLAGDRIEITDVPVVEIQADLDLGLPT